MTIKKSKIECDDSPTAAAVRRQRCRSGASGGTRRACGVRPSPHAALSRPPPLPVEAIKASDRDRDNPPTTSDVERARTADLNNDGYVTLNEVVAMQKSGLSRTEMIRRLEDTGQVFQLSTEQEDYLRDRGVDDEVIRAMRSMNQDRARTASDRRYDDRYDRNDTITDRSDRYDR